jgi:uncharacterized protein YndB with AHSA1/START domain
MTDHVEVERIIRAEPERVWHLIADAPRMGEWSPETVRARWLGGADGPAVGARFKGTNRIGIRRWSTVGTVIAAEPGERFAFEVTGGPLKVARWEYDIEPHPDGCRVVESWTDQRGATMKLLGLLGTGVTDRAVHNRRTMETTLANLASAAESGTAEPGAAAR